MHHGGKTPVSVAAATARLEAQHGVADPDFPGLARGPDGEVRHDDGPMYVREKVHDATPITLDQALYEMELVGHDFYLFVDAETSQPSVVYRRRAYDYGVIRLAV